MTTLPHQECLAAVTDPSHLGVPIPDILDRRVGLLSEYLVPAMLDSVNRAVDSTDGQGRLCLLMGAAFKRTEALLTAFSSLARQRNGQACLVLLRSHLDTAMRLHALWLVDGLDEYFDALLSDEIRQLRSRTGQRLSDSYLHHQLSAHYPGLSADYRVLSGVVHLSTHAVLAPLEPSPDGGFGLRLDHADWPNRGICAGVTAFAIYGAALVHMLDILSLSASGGVLDDILELPTNDAFELVPLRPWLNRFVCASAAQTFVNSFSSD